MLSVLIPYKAEPNHTELKYTIAGLRKFVTQDLHIITIGHNNPYADLNIDFENEDNALRRDWNMFKKLMYVLPGIDGDFIYSADDNFLLKPFDPVPRFSEQWVNIGLYRNTEMNTRNLLAGCKNWDFHYPSLMNKEKFLKAFEHVPFDRPYGFCLKTIYYESIKVIGRPAVDCKLREYPVYSEDWKSWDCVSTGWKNFECIEDHLKLLYAI